jgi:hypothetical protein
MSYFLLERLLEEIIHFKKLSYSEELELGCDLLFLLSSPKEVKEIWNHVNKMSEIRFCNMIIRTGDRKGDMCGKAITSDHQVCEKHYTLLNKEKEKEESQIQYHPKKQLDENIIIHKNKYQNFLFPETDLILDDNNVVIAKEGSDGEYLPLNKKDIKLAKKKHLRYKIIDFNFKGEKIPPELNSILVEETFLSKSNENLSESFHPPDLFVSRPKSNPDANSTNYEI